MFKKCLFFLLALAVMISVSTVAVSAEGLSDSLVVDLAFSEDGVTDLKGHTIELTQDGTMTFHDGYVEMISDVNVQNQIKVNDVINAESPVTFTLELYINLTADAMYDKEASGFDLLNVGSNNLNITPIDGFVYFGAGDPSADTVYEPGLVEGEWVHLVFTSDGTSQTIYMDGWKIPMEDLSMGGDYTVNTIYATSDNPCKDNALILGSYFLAANRITDYQVKICRYYNVAATEDQALALYEARETVSTTEGAVIPTPPPAQAPTEEPSGDEGNVATAAPTQAPAVDNTPTFDMGLISLAAVAISSAVAIKKRK